MTSANSAPMELSDPDEKALPTLDEIRQEHLATEKLLKIIGFLYVVAGALLGGLVALSVLGKLFMGSGDLPGKKVMIAIAGSVVVSVFLFAVGTGLRKLQPNIKISARIITAIWLGGFLLAESTVGTIAAGVALFLLCSHQTKFVLSDGYLEIMELTPKVRAKKLTVMRILICLTLAVVLPIAGLLMRAA